MPRSKFFESAELESIARALGHTQIGLNGDEIGNILRQLKMRDVDGPAETKWRRLFNALTNDQNNRGDRTGTLEFIRCGMKPSQHAHKKERYEPLRQLLNESLTLCGMYVDETGKLREGEQATTLADAADRAASLRRGLATRAVHGEVLSYCSEELLKDNYFHAVFEAAKSVSDRIRKLTGLHEDGAALYDRAFNVGAPYLAINTLTTPSEETEQKGFVNLLKGLHGMFRHPRAHEVKANWKTNQADAEEALALLSYAHKRLDGVIVVPGNSEGRVRQ